MDHDDKSWNAVDRRLRKTQSLKVTVFEVGEGATQDDIEVIGLMGKAMPPPAILALFRSSNGVKLLWNGNLEGQAVEGSVNIATLHISAFRGPQQEDGAPLEGVLWNDEFAPAVRKKLQRMAIFESIAGRSAFLTYFIDEADARLFLVEEDRIRPIVPDFETTIDLLKRYAGAGKLREHLTHADWSQRVAADEALQRIAAL